MAIDRERRRLLLAACAAALASPAFAQAAREVSDATGRRIAIPSRLQRVYASGLRTSGTGVLLSTHRPDDALQLADGVALLHRGRMLADAPPSDAITREHLREAYGIDVELHTFDLADGTRRAACIAVGTSARPCER